MFTGDRSGDWVFGALHAYGFANQLTSTHIDDGLVLQNSHVTAPLHCAPPYNKPLREEFDACQAHLPCELQLLQQVRVVIALRQFAFVAYLRVRREIGLALPSPVPKFGHAKKYDLAGVPLLGSYHPSQQNTFTGRLTRRMFHSVFHTARKIIENDY